MDRDYRRRSPERRRRSPDARHSRRSRSPLDRRRSPLDRRRSRSPLDRRRSRSRDGDRIRDRDRDRDRRRNASPALGRRPERERERSEKDRVDDRRHRSSPTPRSENTKKERPPKPAKKIDLESCQGMDDEMKKLMGFGTFDTTKNKKVPGNIGGAVKINKPRKYRQYMNRKGGFNRPLDYVA